jgi:hypothetical protein
MAARPAWAQASLEVATLLPGSINDQSWNARSAENASAAASIAGGDRPAERAALSRRLLSPGATH